MTVSAVSSKSADTHIRSSWPDLTADLGLLGEPASPARPARVAIASYEFVGVVRNGGIGTACTELARALANDGHEVDLFFTGHGEDPSEEGFDRWRTHYRDLGVSLDRLDAETISRCDSAVTSAPRSFALYELLRAHDEDKPYDVIHFVESMGHGFYSLLAKQQGLAFQQATTVVCTHSPRRWLAEAHGTLFGHPIELGDEFLEVRSLEMADVVVSPSAHMLDWLRDHGVRLPQRSYVQQYVTNFDAEAGAWRSGGSAAGNGASAGEVVSAAAPIEELVFFGRLEPRKGIVTFCDALDLLAERPDAGLKRITFLGKESVPPGFFEARAERWPWEWKVISDFGRDAALDYLCAPGRMAVMASTMDNSPNVVYEAIGLGISFLASRGGGTPELVHPDDFERVTYDPRDPELREVDPGDPTNMRAVHSGRVLAGRLLEMLGSAQEPARFAVPPDVNRETHLAWHRAAAGVHSAPPVPSSTAPLRKLAMDDIASAREVSGDPVLLLDPDVVLDPRLEERLAAAAEACPRAGFFTTLGSFDVEEDVGLGERVFLPTGGPVALGLRGNCMGAGAVLARHDALQRLGPFEGSDRGPISIVDLLTRAALTGERIEVVPEVLYRLPASASRNGWLSYAQDPFELVRPYLSALQPEARDIAVAAARLYQEEAALRAAADELSAQLVALRSSRSMRLTAPLRIPGLLVRRLRRRRSG